MKTETLLEEQPEVKAGEIVPAPPTPMQMLAIAVSQNADVDKLAKLMDLQERWEKNEAHKAFVVALAAFKSNPPRLTKTKQVAFKDVKYKYAPLDDVADQVGRELSKHGLSFRWGTEQKDGTVRVTCTLQHVDGHAETVSLQAPPDTTGSKNAVQAIASTVTYLERYTLLAVTGLATEDQDDDGTGAPTAKLPDLKEKLEWVAGCRNADELKRVFTDAYKVAAAAGDKHAMEALIEAKDKRRREF